MRIFSRFVDSNEREIRRLQPIIDEANSLEVEIEALSDEEIRERFAEIREEIREIAEPDEPSEDELHHPDLERRRELTKERRKKENARIQASLDDVAADVFAMTREAMKRTLGMRHFDVQLMGAAVLHQGRIAEMKTGEGKTLVAPMAAILNSLTGRGVHIVTPNDYLARRDPQWMGPVFHFLGVSLGMVTHDESFAFEPGYPTSDERLINLRPVSRREAYAADVTYGTNNEFGFDYLRDNMVIELDQRVQRERSFAIVDEVDNILIDEARTPLIISGQAEESGDLYYTFARLVPKMSGRPEGAEEGGDFFVDLKDRAVSPTEEGVDKMEGLLGVPNLYDADPRLARHFEQALRAHALYKRDKDYIVKDGEIVIVDEFTGRQMPGRRWSEGLHQAIEAKEGLRVQRESVTYATVTFQNYFRLYDKLAGMTGTAMTEAEEFHKIYQLEVVSVPTHRDMIREDESDLVFRNEMSKFNALIDEIVEMQEQGRPVLVGTVTVEKSEVLSTMLKRRGIKHETLNAKFHEKESGIIAQAGRTEAVTIATNMAGRGTDILLGGNPAGLASEILHKRGLNPAEVDRATYDAALAEAKQVTDEDHERVVAVGGLHIIGTERHDSRRIDNQLRGRAGRQGDPGSSRFYLSLEDDLMKRFANDRVAGLMERLGLDDDVAIESRLVSKTIESAQSRVEGFNFDMRKRVVDFDDVINRQRETIYAERDKVLRNEDLGETVRGFVEDEVHAIVDSHLTGDNVDDWGMEGLAAALQAMGLTGPGTTEDELWELGSRDVILEHLLELADARLEARGKEVGEADWATVERLVLVRTIDSLWVEHLTEIEDMRRGIGLRGYAQQDPLNEFRREAFQLYQELRALIRHQLATTIFRVSLTRHEHANQPVGVGAGSAAASGAATVSSGSSTATATRPAGAAAPGPLGSPIAGGLPPDPMARALRASGGGTAAGGEAKPGFTPTGARIGRNDACWCGSGKKYKKCHGA
jgi:preprotein translocase subunit SecA